jgi:GH15 family glucan-1,4-alpha-glucosidase
VKQVLHTDDGDLVYDNTVDASSLYGPLFFNVFDVDDERMASTAKTIEERLSVTGESKGYVRYEGDAYYRMHDANSPNPWIITTLWLAEYYIAKATKLSDLKRPLEILEWTGTHAQVGGVLAEQMHPETREQLSTAPLVWSHAEFVLAVQAYHQKLEQLKGR